MAGITIDVFGEKEMAAQLKKYGDGALLAVAAGVYSLGNEIVAVAKRNAPVMYGTLRGSGYCTMPQPDGTGRVTCTIGFGGWASAYALYQHEHNRAKSKYLENAVNAYASRATSIIFEVASRMFLEGRPVTQDPNTPTDPFQGPDLRPGKKGRKGGALKRVKRQSKGRV